MDEDEKAALGRLSAHLKRVRSGKASSYDLGDVGLLLCASRRVEYMEAKAEEIALDRTLPGPERRVAAKILGWGPGEHGGPGKAV